MNPESSPFRPGQRVPTEFFVGRTEEIERLRGMVRGSARGRFGIGFVSGERGIGQSSVAAFVRRLVEGDQDAVGCHVFLGGVQDLREMLRRSFDRLLKESIDRPWHRQVKEFFGNRVRQVGLSASRWSSTCPTRIWPPSSTTSYPRSGACFSSSKNTRSRCS